MTKSRLLLALALGWMVVAPPAISSESYAPRVGHRHPDLTLPNIANRQPVSLSQFRGKKVLLIHFASW